MKRDGKLWWRPGCGRQGDHSAGSTSHAAGQYPLVVHHHFVFFFVSCMTSLC